MQTLYPEIKPYARHELAVESPHVLYVDESGSPEGLPVVFVHGGPGGGCDALSRRFFDPNLYRIITFDQRGCGRSTPHASLENNTTAHLIEDMERIRESLGVDKWVLFGGSWGSTLSLAYAQAFPERVHALILRGIFLCRPKEFSWFYQEGASRLFPEAWEHYIKAIPVTERHDLISAFHRRLTSDDDKTRLAAAKAWSVWEGATSFLHIDEDFANSHEDPQFALAFARIENHYFVNSGFFEVDDQLLRDAGNLADIPGVIVHGRYDVVCPVQNATDLHKAWPKSELVITPASGHSAFEAETVDALVRATDAFA